MAFMGKSGGAATIGLDIGTGFIKAVELRGGRGKFALTAVGVAPTPPGSIEDGVILSPQEIGIAVRQLLKTNGFSTNRVISSVAGQSALVVRIIEVPEMSRKELAQTMKWEVERHVPFSANEVFMDFAPLPPDPIKQSQGNMEVLLAVAQETLINTHLEILSSAGLEPQAIDVAPLASARALVNIDSEGAALKTVAIVNIGAATTDFSIVKDGVLVFPRSLPIAGRTFTKAISDVMNISVDDAETLKKQKARIAMADDPAAAPKRTQAIPAAAPTMNLGMDLDDATPPVTPAPPPPPDDDGLSFVTPDDAPVPVDLDLDDGHGVVKPKDIRFDVGADESDKYTPLLGAPIPEAPVNPPVLSSAPAPTGPAITSGGSDPESQAVFNAIRPVLDDLAKEIRRSIDYFRSRTTGGVIDEIHLCGGTAKMPGLDRFLEDDLALPVFVADPLVYVEVASKKITPAYVEDVASLLPVALGLAMREMLNDTADLVAAKPGKSKKT